MWPSSRTPEDTVLRGSGVPLTDRAERAFVAAREQRIAAPSDLADGLRRVTARLARPVRSRLEGASEQGRPQVPEGKADRGPARNPEPRTTDGPAADGAAGRRWRVTSDRAV